MNNEPRIPFMLTEAEANIILEYRAKIAEEAARKVKQEACRHNSSTHSSWWFGREWVVCSLCGKSLSEK